MSDIENDGDAESDASEGPSYRASAMANAMGKILREGGAKSGGILSKSRRKRSRRIADEESRNASETKRPLPPPPSAETETWSPELEKHLKTVATRGIAKLFNAVRKQQKDVDAKIKKAGMTEAKRVKVHSAVNKAEFLDALKSGDVKVREKEEEKKKKWGGIFRDNFMMRSRMKDWKTSDDEDVDDDK